MSIGLVLEGGGMRAIYTAGVLDVLMENSINVDGIIGVSAGVLFGVNYLSKQPGRVIRYNDTYKASDIPFYATVSNIETGNAEYIQLHDVFEQMELLSATSAMPYVSEIIEYDGKKYLDGGITDSIPFKKSREMGYKKTIIVLTRPIEYRKKKSKFSLSKIKYGKYPNFVKSLKNRYQLYNNTVEEIINLEKDGKNDIFVIRPSRTIKIKRVEKDENKVQEMYELGRTDANNLLEKLVAWMAK